MAKEEGMESIELCSETGGETTRREQRRSPLKKPMYKRYEVEEKDGGEDGEERWRITRTSILLQPVKQLGERLDGVLCTSSGHH